MALDPSVKRDIRLRSVSCACRDGSTCSVQNDILAKIASRHPISRIDELLPWAYASIGRGSVYRALEGTGMK
jgi:hypothetical protein